MDAMRSLSLLMVVTTTITVFSSAPARAQTSQPALELVAPSIEPESPLDVATELKRMQARIDQLESRLSAEMEVPLEDSPLLIDADPYQADPAPPEHVLARRWFENFNISGFAAFNFLATGNNGTHPQGGFTAKESTLWIEPQVWDNTTVFVELQINRLGKDDTLATRTGELHAHFRNVWESGCGDFIGIKVGRIDIPFGEEYLWQDSISNPLITQSAAYPYGFDEGILLYGRTAQGLGWLLAVTDGTDGRSLEDHWDKAVNLKLYGDLSDHVYLSGSVMRNGRSGESAFEFGGSHLQPVGADHPSTLGTSTSRFIDSVLYQVDLKLSCEGGNYLAFAFGQAFIDDDNSRFDRDLLWYMAEYYQPLTETTYAVARFSDIGTFDASDGYHFDGKITASGNNAFGYDTRRFQRLSAGLGWRPNQRTVVKAEVGNDWFDVIDGSPFTPRDDDRWLAGVEVVLGF